MTRRWQAARTWLRRVSRDDQGTTLMELVVGMALMTVFMSIFLTAILMITRTANKVEATTISTSQTTQAFLRLDRTVRYASAISTPGLSATSGNWYVEFDTQSQNPQTTGYTDTCTQVRIAAKQLQLRTWTVTSGTAAAASSWTPIASFVSNGTAAAGSANVPFTLLPAGATASTAFQRLQVTLVTSVNSSASATNRSQTSFTALNSDVTQPTNATVCQQWGRP